jgi:hypothetical protein
MEVVRDPENCRDSTDRERRACANASPVQLTRDVWVPVPLVVLAVVR